MPDARALTLACALCGALAVPSGAAAQDDTTARHLLELPGHRTLMDVAATAPLAPFTTDGCSGGLSDTWRRLTALLPSLAERHGTVPPWEACCIRHDEVYHNAGGATTAEASFTARLQADEALRDCVAAMAEPRMPALMADYGMTETQIRASYALISRAMFDAVRLGGVPCSGLPWRWGYGYPQCPVLPDLSRARSD